MPSLKDQAGGVGSSLRAGQGRSRVTPVSMLPSLLQCTPGYSGENCSEELSACQSQPCHNHGTCTPRSGGFHCTCPAGFVGPRCEGDVDECLDRPCHPTGTAACRSLANAFHCDCLPGHTGEASRGVQDLRGPMAPMGRPQPPVHSRATWTPLPASCEASARMGQWLGLLTSNLTPTPQVRSVRWRLTPARASLAPTGAPTRPQRDQPRGSQAAVPRYVTRAAFSGAPTLMKCEKQGLQSYRGAREPCSGQPRSWG